MSVDVLKFEDFELDARRYSLCRGGRSLKLERIPMELLLLLVERRGELVTREEIVLKLWGKDVFLDTDNGINTAIRKIRQVLRDDLEQPRFIQTVAGKGYRFIAPISEEKPEAAVSPSPPPAISIEPAPAPGQVVSHYRILTEIGAGGMGVVYEGEDLRLGRHVALKFLPEKSVLDDEALARFLREARAASSLNHPNICTIYEVEEHAGRPVLIMELLEGETLKEAIRRGPMPLDQLYSTVRQLTDGLGAAHSNGIIHRDIKPGNIFLTKRGLVKILDFGLAKLTPDHLVPAEDFEDPLTRAGALPGTTPYMSPEQVRGEKLDARSDLFSLGVVLFEASTGKKPFAGKNAVMIMDAIRNSRPSPASRVNPSLPLEIDSIIDRALEKDPTRRYQTAAEFSADLEALRKPEALPKPAPNGLKGTATTAKRPRASTAALVLLAVAIIAAFGLWLILNRRKTARIHGPAEWVQLTHFSDGAQEPALSPDGRMLAFLREKSLESTIPFVAAGQIYVMLLPEGEPQQVTRDSNPKGMIAFSPDGTRMAYTVPSSWDTWVVSSFGGDSQLLLPNASGLTWIDNHRLLFSEIKTGIHMGIVTAAESRRDAREVYFPPTQNGMAHLSHISPDQKLVLVSGEMDLNGFLPCRVVPFNGDSPERQVGPPGAKCFYSAWSPDGRWMYFGADSGAGMHIFRQRFPDGPVVQLTFGPTEEKGLAIAPDGRSLITSVTSDERNVWVHIGPEENPVSSDGFSGQPTFSKDGKKLFYLWRSTPRTGGFFAGELRSRELASGKTESLLPGVEIEDYALSPDARLIVFTALDQRGKARLWVAQSDRRSPPRQLTASDAPGESNARFGPQGDIFFDSTDNGTTYAFRRRSDGTGRTKVIADAVLSTVGLSPDGRWLVANVPRAGGNTTEATVAIPIGAGAPMRICNKECFVDWSADGKFLYMTPKGIGGMNARGTYAIPLKPGKMFPEEFPASGIDSEAGLSEIPGAERIPKADIAPGSNPSTYAFVSSFHRSNLYRIPID